MGERYQFHVATWKRSGRTGLALGGGHGGFESGESFPNEEKFGTVNYLNLAELRHEDTAALQNCREVLVDRGGAHLNRRSNP